MSIETTDTLAMNEFERPTRPGLLNVITILTIIGSVLMIFGSIWQFAVAQKNYDEKNAAIAKMTSPETPAFARNMMGSPAEYELMVTKNLENKVPLLITSLVAAALCLYGAIQMRKLNKQGYILYIIGEVLPFICMAIFLGTFAMKGFAFYFTAGIAVLFILMYTSQRKYLVY